MFNDLSIKTLLKNFSPATKSDWNNAANSETKKNDSLVELTWKGPDGLSFSPYYDQSDVTFNASQFHLTPNNLHEARHWLNLPPLHLKNSDNTILLPSNASGADGAWIEWDHTPPDIGAHLKTALHPLHLYFYSPDTEAADHIANELVNRASHPMLASVALFRKKISQKLEPLSSDLHSNKNFYMEGIFIPEDENPVEEIAAALYEGTRLADRLTEDGQAPEKILPHIAFSFESGADFFYTVAKLKAIRFLWHNVMRAYNIHTHQPMDTLIHVRCKPWKDEKFQPHGTMLYSTSAALASILGGCSALTVHPEDANNVTTARIARNVSVILREESHIGRVADPLAGSYLIDNVINTFAQRAWELFLKKDQSL